MDFPRFWITKNDPSGVPIENLLIVIILLLHQLVSGFEPLFTMFESSPIGIKHRLQAAVQVDGTGNASMHRGQHLDVLKRIESETFRDIFRNHPGHLFHDLFRV